MPGWRTTPRPDDDLVAGSFDQGRGRILLRLLDAAVVALGSGSVLTLISEKAPPAHLAVAVVADLTLIVLTVHHLRVVVGRGWPWPPRLTLTASALLVYGLLPVIGHIWLITPFLLLIGIISVLPPRRAWPWAALVIVAEPALAVPFHESVSNALFRTVQIVISAAVLWGLARAVALAEELSQARQELAELAVVRERLRVARDLHDSLGQSLTAIGLQAELAQRWCAKGDSGRVTDHLTRLLDLTQTTGAEMRGLVTSYRRLSLAAEARAAAGLLADRGVTCRVDVADVGLPTETEQALAWCLREAVTNVVRHSEATRCTIALTVADGVRLVVGNDAPHAQSGPMGSAMAPGQPGPAAAGGGNGLLGVADRALGLGGWSQTRLGPDGWFELTVHLPASALVASPAETALEQVVLPRPAGAPATEDVA